MKWCHYYFLSAAPYYLFSNMLVIFLLNATHTSFSLQSKIVSNTHIPSHLDHHRYTTYPTPKAPLSQLRKPYSHILYRKHIYQHIALKFPLRPLSISHLYPLPLSLPLCVIVSILAFSLSITLSKVQGPPRNSPNLSDTHAFVCPVPRLYLRPRRLGHMVSCVGE